MKTTLASLFLTGIFLICGSSAVAQQPAPQPQHNLMPVPASITFEKNRLAVDESFKVATRGHSDARLQAAIARFVKRLEGRTVLSFTPGLAADDQMTTLIVACDGPGQDIPSVSENESYRLDITNRQALLSAPTVVGAIRGLETVLQLLSSDRGGFFLPGVKLQDQPRFPWRGLLIDVGRHFEPMEVLKRNLDAMAAVKLNVLHWHLTEDQGFRVESKRFPKLHEQGSDGLFYTQDQIRDVVAYARDRGIRVVPEFDIPGHTTSWIAAYPELGTNPGKVGIWRRWGISENALDPSREETYQFLDEFFGEITPLFPDPFFHIGGDEVMPNQWNASARVQAFAKEH